MSMPEQVLERCIYCGAEIAYAPDAKVVKCVACGNRFTVTRFQSEQAKLKAALREGEAAKAALAEAEAARDAAQARLGGALDALQDIRASQADGERQLEQLLDGMDADRETRQAMAQLLDGLRAGQADARDVLARLMAAFTRGHGDASEKLERMAGVCGRILKAQGDIFTRLQMQSEIARQLRELNLTELEQQRLAADFTQWSQNVHDEDAARLDGIQSAAGALLEGQRRMDDRVAQLQRTADQTQRTLEAFQAEYQADKLDELEQLYRQAEKHQRDRAFDRASDAYRQVIVKGGADVEVYWRLLLCHYCIEYQRDDEGSLVPTILNPDLTDPAEMSLRQDLDKAIPEGSGFYRRELARIDRILENYRQIRDRVRFDVFISVKQNENGRITEDSDRASDLYDRIASRGLRVFNSRRTKIPAGQEYEPYIISALISAKLLIVVGGSAAHMDAQWIRNEWSRFQWLQRDERARAGRSDRVLVCYLVGGMRPNEIPRALNPNRQAIVDGMGSESTLDALLRQVFPKRYTEPAEPRPAPAETPEQAVNQMTTWLYQHKYEQVLEKYDALTRDGRFLDHARVHLCALCARLQLDDVDQLPRLGQRMLDAPEFRAAERLAKSPEDRALLKKLRDRAEAAADGGSRKGRGGHRGLAALAACAAVALAVVGALAAMGRGPFRPAPTPTPSYVVFSSSIVEKAVRSALGKASDDIYPEELTRIEKLMIYFSDISDISDLAMLTQLKELYLSSNKISDLTPLSGLTGLEVLSLQNNSISDITPLSGLAGLKWLYLGGNSVSDLTPLSGLTQLETLSLSNNRISDVSPLSGLTRINMLWLYNNNISDVTPLSGLSGLTYLSLSGNPVADYSPVSFVVKLYK